MKRAINRTIRTLGQVIAAGGLTSLIAALADGLDAWLAGVLVAGGAVAMTFTQTLLEGLGAVKAVLDDPPAPSANERYVSERLRSDEGNRPRSKP